MGCRAAVPRWAMQQCVQGCPVLCWSTRTWGCAGNSPAWSREICLASSVVPLILDPPSPTVDVSEVSLGTFAAWLSRSICPAGLQTEAGVKAGGSRQRPHRDSALPACLPPGTERSVIKPLAADASRSCAVVSPVWGSCRSPRAPIAITVLSSSPTAISTSPPSPVHLWIRAVQGAGAMLDVTQSWAHSPALAMGFLGQEASKTDVATLPSFTHA